MRLTINRVHILYPMFKGIVSGFSLPVLFMRSIYLQYILSGTFIILYIIIYGYQIKNKCVNQKLLIADIILWSITTVELIFVEPVYLNLLWL